MDNAFLIKGFLSDFRRTINGKTLLSVFAVTALCFFSHIFSSEANPPTIFELMTSTLTGGKNRCTCQDAVNYFDGSYWFYIVLPVILSAPAVSDFFGEWFSGRFYLNLCRRSVRGYAVSKTLAYSLNSVLSFAAGLILFIIPVMIIFPDELPDTLLVLYPEGFWSAMLPRFLNTAAVTAVYPLFAVIITILIKEKFLALSIPMLLNYVAAQLGSALSVKAFADDRPDLNKIVGLLPYFQSTQYISFENTFGMPLYIWYSAWGLCFVLLAAAFYFLIKRRVRNGG